MKNLFFVFRLLFTSVLFIGCADNKVNFDCSTIVRIDIENRAAHRFGGVDHIVITDKEKISEICNSVSSLSAENNEFIKPLDGSIVITFSGPGKYYLSPKNEYTTGIIFKENDNYLITTTNGYFRDDEFLEEIKKLLKMK
jgi:hypothetical protein